MSGLAAVSSGSAAQIHEELIPAGEEDFLTLQNPLSELCPSLLFVQSLASQPVAQFAGGTPEKSARLTRALLRACTFGDSDLVTWILQVRSQAVDSRLSKDAQPEAIALAEIDLRNARDENGSGAMVLAASGGHVDIVHMLVQAGAELDERDSYGWTPLMWAINSSNAPLVAFLLSHGADVRARSSRGTSCEDFVLSTIAREESSQHADAGPSRLAMPLDAEEKQQAADRELIVDLVYEHLQNILRDPNALLRQPHDAASPLSRGAGSAPGSPQASHPQASPSPALQGLRSPLAALSSHYREGSLGSTGLRRLIGRDERVQLAAADLKAREVAEARRRALMDAAVLLELDYSNVIGGPPPESEVSSPERRTAKRKPKSLSSRKRTLNHLHRFGLASGCGALEVGADPLSAEFRWDEVLHSQMLVVSLEELPLMLDQFISSAKPMRAPWTARAAPANFIFLCARFAAQYDSDILLEEVILGSIQRIEDIIYARSEDLSIIAFWLFNCCLLLHYTQRDLALSQKPQMAEHRELLADVITEIYAFVIRDVERRIDKVMDAAILDHDAIPGHEEVRFESEWKFMQKLTDNLTGSVKGLGASPNSASARRVPSASNSSPTPRRPLSQIFGRREPATPEADSSKVATPASALSGSPQTSTKDAWRQPHPSPARSVGLEAHSSSTQRTRPSSLSAQTYKEDSRDMSAESLLAKPSPRTITALLTATLHVLQLYEINPIIIVQALSQVFFWVGCELFNRVLTRRKYLCQSRAMQIRLNVSALEDWARSNALPLSIINVHFEPLRQLISWLQSQSTLQEFVDLLSTMQGMRVLNPLQLRRAVRDYRYQVGEPRMSPDCAQYLEQLQKDWERRQQELQQKQASRQEEEVEKARARARANAKPHVHHRSGTETQHGRTPDSRSPSPATADEETLDALFADSMLPMTREDELALKTQDLINSLFVPGKSVADYHPPWGAAGGAFSDEFDELARRTELLNSRDMLPFAPGDAFGFGRGHFQGTGTPGLRIAQQSAAGGLAQSPFANSRPGSPAVSASGYGDGSRSPSRSDDGQSEDSQASSARTGVSVSSRTSSLFAQGKGVSAGAFWQPVPILPEGTLEKVDELARKVAASRPPLQSRLALATTGSPLMTPTSARLEGASLFGGSRRTSLRASLEPPGSPSSVDRTASLSPADTLIPPPLPKDKDGQKPRGLRMSRAAAYGYGDTDDEEEVRDELLDDDEAPRVSSRRVPSRSPSRESNNAQQRQQQTHQRSVSGLSIKPTRLVLPPRKALGQHALNARVESEGQDIDTDTPVERRSAARLAS
ncbi:PROTEIN F40G9.17 [Ceraceosorus bombacis]|uniref:PROTEIN F40G9.17 n=1 Tax=Ceraceosorus bombacis TaxID=401625 RepID=A0A0P1BGA3_9BASI|nr:PROTEIN F40G9.17 [Ceraceosorus bombacis]